MISRYLSTPVIISNHLPRFNGFVTFCAGSTVIFRRKSHFTLALHLHSVIRRKNLGWNLKDGKHD